MQEWSGRAAGLLGDFLDQLSRACSEGEAAQAAKGMGLTYLPCEYVSFDVRPVPLSIQCSERSSFTCNAHTATLPAGAGSSSGISRGKQPRSSFSDLRS